MKDELIKEMRVAVSCYTNVHHDKVIELCAEAALTIMSREWVRVEDRLPEEAGEYLVSVKYFTRMDAEIATYWKEDDMWVFEKQKICNYKITHWMPLPTPPKQ